MWCLHLLMKYVAMATLLTGIMWHFPANLQSYLDFVIAAGAVFVLVQAVKLRKYAWVAAFVAVACVFNPIRPLGFSAGVPMAMGITSMLLFAGALPLLKTSPRMTIASITEANPRTESL